MDGYADIARLMPSPAGLGRGWVLLQKPPAPAPGGGYVYAIANDAWERIRAVTFSLSTSATAGNRQVLASWQDGDGFIYDQVAASVVLRASGSTASFLSDRSPTPAPTTSSLSQEASVTDPGPLGTIVSIAGVPAGQYQVQVTAFLSGTVTAADQDNMQLSYGGAVTPGIPVPGVANVPVTWTSVIELPAGHAVTVQSVAAASGASAVYNASLTVTAVSGQVYYGNIPGWVLKSGHSLALSVNGAAAGDQLSQIGILTERYPSDWAAGDLAEEHRHAWAQLAAELSRAR